MTNFGFVKKWEVPGSQYRYNMRAFEEMGADPVVIPYFEESIMAVQRENYWPTSRFIAVIGPRYDTLILESGHGSFVIPMYHVFALHGNNATFSQAAS
jgi:hypothetical protein